MFHDLDTTLTHLLDDEHAPPALIDADISFVTPDKAFAPTQATVSLFLYDVKENRELRDPVPIVEKVGGAFVRRRPPMRVDCSYIVTAWSHATGAARVVEEHRLLAETLGWLSRFPVVPTSHLQGELVSQPFPLMMTVCQMDPNKNAGEFWSALGIAPRPAFYVTVTVALDAVAMDAGTLVTTRMVSAQPGTEGAETLVLIGGRVFARAAAVVRAQASVVSSVGVAVTVTNAADAARFQPGDDVLLEQAGTSERATVRSTSGSVVTLERLDGTFSGGTLRVANLATGQQRVRLDGMAGITPGAYVCICQGGRVEEAIVKTVDQASRSLLLTQGLSQDFTMDLAALPITVRGTIGGARVDVLGMGRSTTSSVDGRFTFPRVLGTHSLRAHAVGFQPTTKSIQVPGSPEDYELTLDPL